MDIASRDAAITDDLVSRLQVAAETLSTLQVTANQYLDSVTQVLKQSHESFASNMMNTLRDGNTQFHTELSTAVGYLQSAIMDLGDMLDSVSVRRP